MKHLMALTVMAGLAAASAQTLTPTSYDFGVTAGYYNGLNLGLSLHAPNIYQGFGARLALDYIFPQDPLNDSYNFGGTGTWGQYKSSTGASESGNQFSVALDATYALPSQVPNVDAYVYAGPRYDFYSSTANFGSSGSTTYTTSQLGLGAGFLANYALSNNLLLTGNLGVDYYFPSSITAQQSTGGSTTFNPGDSGYSDAAFFINQPSLVPKARLGLTYRY